MTRYKFLDELLSNKYHRLSMEELTEEVNKRLAYIDGKPVGVRCIQKDKRTTKIGQKEASKDHLESLLASFCDFISN